MSVKTAPGVERPPLADEDRLYDRLAELSSAPRPLASLATALRRGRLSASLMLFGPRGAGKRHAAIRLAQLLDCSAPGPKPSDGPCGGCASCRRTLRGLDTNVRILEPEEDGRGRRRTEITVGQVRALQDSLAFKHEGSRRFLLIDPADRLSLVAQEALLKTIEEPPDGLTVVLSCERPAAMKPTMRSRCQAVACPLPEVAALTTLLEEQGLTTDQARKAAQLSGRDLHRALTFDAEDEADRWLDLARRLYEMLGRRGEGKARDLALELLPPKGRTGADAAEHLEEILGRLELILRDVMVEGALHREGLPVEGAGFSHPDGESARKALAGRLAPGRAARLLDEVATARADLALHVNTKTVLTDLLLKIHRSA
ncbi:MAG: hypothetical protein AAF533_15565 [Acidobacteriota bacterium]